MLGADSGEAAQLLRYLRGRAVDGLLVGFGLLVAFEDVDEGAGALDDLAWVTADLLAVGGELVVLGFGVGRVEVPDGVEAVGVAGGQLEHARAARADPDGDAAGGGAARAQGGVGDGVILAVKVYVSLADEWDDDLEGLVEAGGEVVEGVAEGGELGLVPAGAEAENEAAAADLVNGVGDLGGEGGWAEGGAGDEGAELDAGGDGGEGADDGEHLPGAGLGAVGEAEDEVVGDPEGVEADLLSGLGLGLEVAEAGHLAGFAVLVHVHREAELHAPGGGRGAVCHRHAGCRPLVVSCHGDSESVSAGRGGGPQCTRCGAMRARERAGRRMNARLEGLWPRSPPSWTGETPGRPC